jgi:hypothetical protein
MTQAHEHCAYFSVRSAHRRYAEGDWMRNALTRMGWKVHRNKVNRWMRDNPSDYCRFSMVALWQGAAS